MKREEFAAMAQCHLDFRLALDVNVGATLMASSVLTGLPSAKLQ